MNPKFEKRPSPGPTLARVLRYMIHSYRFQFAVVLICILGSALATLRGTLFLQSLIDDYILPLAQSGGGDFGPLARALVSLACVYAAGILCAYGYNRIMVNISQGTMRRLRVELFTRMESLPIRYFDTNAHGDIMSVYTNDVDTLRQLMSQSLPQMINSGVTIAATFISMVALNIPLTLITLVMVAIMLMAASKLGGRSAAYFAHQQADLGKVNGYIEEMMDGQKVVKVFCHEEKSLEGFRQLNEQLRQSADNANKFANILMPVNANLGNISYVLCAVAGAALALNSWGGLTLGALVSFLTLNKNFTQPVTQDQPAAEQRGHGHGGRPACVRPDGPAARGGQGLCNPGERQRERGRHPHRMRRAHRPVGLEAPSPRRHPHLHPAAGQRGVQPCGLRLRRAQAGAA